MTSGELPMPDIQSDHDLLISLNTKMEMLIRQMGDYNNQFATLSARISILENRDGRDSEKFTSIQRDMSEWLKSAGQVPTLIAKVDGMSSEIADLKSKSNTWSILNSVGVALAALFAWVFGR